MLSSSKDLKTSACTAGGRPHPVLLRLMARLPQDVTDRYCRIRWLLTLAAPLHGLHAPLTS